MMGETAINAKSIKERLAVMGIEGIVVLSLAEEKYDNGLPKRSKVNDYITCIGLKIDVDPMFGWRRAIGKFYENTRYHDPGDWRVKELQALLKNDDLISYFATRPFTFRLSNEDNVTIIRSMTEHINQITTAGIQMCFVGKNKYDPSLLSEARRITRDVDFKPYVIGRDNYAFLKEDDGSR